nr:PREDICTED: RNA-binding protein 48 [Paralichthys olivaceus]
MAASSGSSSSCWDTPEVYKHHEQRKVCISRPKYREGRNAKAVKFLEDFTLRSVREKEQKEAGKEEPTTSNTATTSEKIISRHDRRPDNDNTGENLNLSHYSGFPLLPLPPQECHYYGHKNQHGTVPTEDKMGTLHNAIIDTRQEPAQDLSFSQTSSDRDTELRLTPDQAPAVRFVPRTTNLENRKRKIQASQTQTAVSGKNEPLIGPKLPEPPKLNMEDESLNKTVSLIRNTMKQVESVPVVKPVEKKMKPRRRI